MRFCDVCGRPMRDGFVVNDGDRYYCSEGCLHEDYTEEEYKEMYSQGYAYWTEWEDEDD